MENTCKIDCNRYKKREKECPNYVRTAWKNDKGDVKVVEDCAPIRTMMMLQELLPRLTGIQKAIEQSRNLRIDLGAEVVKRINGHTTNQDLLTDR